MTPFSRFDLRTTDADAARAFYSRVLGHDRASIWPLHENARARGARPHWLGQLAVEDVEQAAAAFVERGATRLGPKYERRDGGETAVLRDPGGAVVAVATPPKVSGDPGPDVVWHVLNTSDAVRAARNYSELFGWALGERIDLGAQGVFLEFAWQGGGESVGAMADIASRPGVHPHWLFFFAVDALEPALAAVRAGGGAVVQSFTLPDGRRISACDDGQGAAFALAERGR